MGAFGCARQETQLISSFEKVPVCVSDATDLHKTGDWAVDDSTIWY